MTCSHPGCTAHTVYGTSLCLIHYRKANGLLLFKSGAY